MRNRILLLIVLIVSGVFATSALAQDATATPEPMTDGMVTCDSDLVLSLYIAEYYFDFGTFHDRMVNAGEDLVDLSTIDKGEFSPLFDSMMSNMNMMGSMMSSDTADAMAAAMAMDAPVQMSTDPVNVDEPEECRALRTELRGFYRTLVNTQNMVDTGMGMDMMTPSMEATEEMGMTPALSADAVTFVGTFSGPAEVPGPGDADAVGTATVTVDVANALVCYSIAVQSIELPASAAHIHQAPIGESGPPVVPLDAPDANGNAAGCVTVDAAIATAIAENPLGYYVNVHTSVFPDGAARAQLGGA